MREEGKKGSDVPHARTGVEELEQLASGPDPKNAARRSFFAACLTSSGSLTVRLTKEGDGPRLLRRYAEIPDEDRVRVLRSLGACVPNLSLEDIAKRLYIA